MKHALAFARLGSVRDACVGNPGGQVTEEEKRKICRLVAGLVTTDEDFDDAERTFMDKMLLGFGIPEGEWDAIFPQLDTEEAAQEIGKMPSQVQAEAFALLVGAAKADGQIAEEEREFLITVGGGMGLSEADVDAKLA
jgi:tellurite resistance protein